MKSKKKTNNLKKVLITSIVLMILWIFGFYLYVTYTNIEITSDNYTVKKIRFHSRGTNCGKRRRK